MSGLLNSLRNSKARQSDDHGVAELLEAVSKRSMSCTEEEKQELDNMSRRVREHNNHKPNPVEMLQKRLSGMQMGNSNHSNRSSQHGEISAAADDYNSSGIVSPTTNSNKPKLNMSKIGSPLNSLGKDIARGLSGWKTQISQAKIQVEERLHAHEFSPQQRIRPTRPSERNELASDSAMLRDVNAEPTIVVLPPLDDPKLVPPNVQSKEKQELISSSDPAATESAAEQQNVFVISDEDNDVAMDDKATEGTSTSISVEGEEEKKQDL
jgi:hypothetical protein